MIAWLVMTAAAHPLAPASLDVNVVDVTTAELRFREPVTRPVGAVELQPALQGECALREGPPEVDDRWVTRTWQATCSEPVADAAVTVEGLPESLVDVVVTVHEGGTTGRHLLTAQQPTLPLVTPSASWTAFFGLGVTHLLEGLDHVLLVLGLVVLLGPSRRLFMALTAFTFGHSVTLAWVALGGGAPTPLVELAIAASLVWLALELSAPPRDPGWLARRPALVGTLIGLLHGAGFGGALTALGLPRDAVVASLFAFNVGIEIGQLAIVAVLGALVVVTPASVRQRLSLGRDVAAYVIGGIGMALVLERLYVFVA